MQTETNPSFLFYSVDYLCDVMRAKELIPIVAVTALVSAGVGAYTAGALVEEPTLGQEGNPDPAINAGARNLNSSAYQQAYQNLMDSVVSLRVTTTTGRGQGTGFVYDSNGHIVTNHHVIQNAETVQVMFREGEWREAEIVGQDVYSDLAVLKVDDIPSYIEDLDIAQSDPKPGQVVMALGNPFGLQETITHGIISGVNRSMDTAGNFQIPDTVQTDAPINPGNSGGPLINKQGLVVGVNRAKQGDNIGFAISPQIVERVVPSLIENGEYQHPYLGISMRDVTPTIANAMNLEKASGVMVAATVEGGPSAGVLEGGNVRARTPAGSVRIGGDIITGIEGKSIDSSQELTSYLSTQTRPGGTVEITIIREGERQTVEVELGTRPKPNQQRRVAYR